jgi:hypothetical protein
MGMGKGYSMSIHSHAHTFGLKSRKLSPYFFLKKNSSGEHVVHLSFFFKMYGWLD